jgi:hypothetical protein
MRLFGKILAVLAVVTSFAAPSETFAAPSDTAVPVTAPALSSYPSFSGRRTLFCDIRNVSTGSGVVTIDILDYSSEVLFSSGPITLASFEATAFSDQGTGTGVSCRFTVSGSSNQWRGVAVYDNGTDYTMAIPAQ